MIRRVLVANRGEIAVRVIRACRELGIESVAVYSTADSESLAVRLADRAVCIGPPASSESYLRIDRIIAAAQTTGCDAVHPGYGFLSENPAFVRACAQHELVFVGPSAEVMETMGDKARAKETMLAAGLPLVPDRRGGSTRSNSPTTSPARSGFRSLIKAAAGGGGRGMRVVEERDGLERAFADAFREAAAAFGDGGLYMERLVRNAHHVEIQIVGDSHGGVLVAGERECSIQRRHQKLLEEAPSPSLSHELRARMYEAGGRACRALRYTGAGTIEFLVGGDEFFFMEMNTRLQVEHPVTEAVTGVDLVAEQLRVASGGHVSRSGVAAMTGHAIEFRINAEDPSHGFRPSPGLLARFRPPLGPGVRVDTHVYEGYRVPPNYDSLVAKVIVWAPDREACIARSHRVLGELEIDGIATTRDLHRDILNEPVFRAGRYTTSYLDLVAADLPHLG